MSQDTVSVDGTDFPRDALEAAVERYDHEEHKSDGTGVCAEPVVLRDDGYLDTDVKVLNLDTGEGTGLIDIDDVADAVETADGPFLLAATTEQSENCGCKVPLDADFAVRKRDSDMYPYMVAWHEDDNVSDTYADGSERIFRDTDVSEDDYDHAANVDTLEIVE